MMSYFKRRSLHLWYGLGVLAIVSLGAPVAGVVSTLASMLSGGEQDVKLLIYANARRIVRGTASVWQPGPLIRPDFPQGNPYQINGRNCEEQLRVNAAGTLLTKDSSLIGLYKAVVAYEHAQNLTAAKKAAAASLARLPAFAVVALAECLDHSILSGACSNLSGRVLYNDKNLQISINEYSFSNARANAQLYCKIVDAPARDP